MKQKNIWKVLFFTLLSIILIFVVSFVFLLFSPTDQEALPDNTMQEKNVSQFLIQTKKADLNKLINHYIEKEGLNGPVNYEIVLTDEVELYGEVKVFSEMLHLKMTFEPEALENGDLVLRQKTVSLGDVKLPVSHILKFIRDAYKFPDWVIIHPNDKQIYVELQKMKFNGDMEVRAEEFDLTKDNISMKMLVPVE